MLLIWVATAQKKMRLNQVSSQKSKKVGNPKYTRISAPGGWVVVRAEDYVSDAERNKYFDEVVSKVRVRSSAGGGGAAE